jgi:predicted amino acid dehydrogenase
LPPGADAPADLDRRVVQAVARSRARVVALAGMLPSHLGLDLTRLLHREPDGGRIVTITTGHAATVAAMFLTVRGALAAAGVSFAQLRVGALGFGSIGRATWELCRLRLGEPAAFVAVDPRLPGGADPAALSRCDLILGASSGGATLDVAALAPGTIVIDDSFPRAFSDEQAWRRMRQRRDVLLAGGGMLDAGPLARSSPFPEADAVRRRFPVRWLPGCHAEALIIARRPELGPTRGPVDTARALAMLAAIEELGLTAAPLHLGPDELPPAVIEGVAAARPK